MNQLWNGSGWTILNSSYGTTAINLGSAEASPSMRFETGGANTVATTKMIILNGGSVGIGTTAPTARLTVTGQGSGVALVGDAGFTSNYTGISLNGTLSTSAYNFLSSPTEPTLYINRPSGYGINFREANGTSQMIINTGGTIGMISSLSVNTGTQSQTIGSDGTYGTNYPMYSFTGISNGSHRIFAGIADDMYFAAATSRGFVFRPNGGTSNSFVILAGGSVGIGTTSPAYTLDVSVGANAGSFLRGTGDVRYHVFSTSATNWVGYELRSSNVNSFAGGIFRNNGDNNRVSLYNKNAEAISLMDAGSVGIGTTSPGYKLDVDGTIRATGDVIAYSDARVKTNVKTLEKALEKINLLRGVSYTRTDSEDKSEKIGVIAQEVLEILPQVVQQDDSGNYSVAYGNMVGVLIEAVKELSARIEQLENK
jgi:hypothetical protein